MGFGIPHKKSKAAQIPSDILTGKVFIDICDYHAQRTPISHDCRICIMALQHDPLNLLNYNPICACLPPALLLSACAAGSMITTKSNCM